MPDRQNAPTCTARHLFPANDRRKRAAGRAAGRTAFRPRRLSAACGVLQPVETLPIAGHAFRASSPAMRTFLKNFLLYRTYQGCAMKPAHPYGKHRRVQDASTRGRKPALVPDKFSNAIQCYYSRPLDVALPDAAFYLVGAHADQRHRIHATAVSGAGKFPSCPAAISDARCAASIRARTGSGSRSSPRTADVPRPRNELRLLPNTVTDTQPP